jgi:hypothetical protein
MWTVESLLTNAVKRFVDHISDLADRDACSATPNAWALTGNSRGAKNAGDATTKQAAPEGQAIETAGAVGLFAVVTSNLLNMIGVTTVFATVLAVLLGVAKWT